MVACIIVLAQVFSVSDPPLSIDTLCNTEPRRIHTLFSELDLDAPGLEATREAAQAKDWPAACRALLEYYHRKETSRWRRLSLPPSGTGRHAAADEILDGVFTSQNVSAKVPLRADGGVDWGYNGPDGDKEWGWIFNRQHWATILLRAYIETANVEYVQAFDRLIQDWILANPYPGRKNDTPQWRGLEAYSRIQHVWPNAFYALQEIPEFTPATRILMLSSVPHHAHYARNYHAEKGNWIAMELLGLATASVAWPEFRDAQAWFNYAIQRILPEMERQVYPDGAQKELSTSYHRVALNCFERFLDLADSAGKDVPQSFRDGVERMYNYLAYSVRPSGYGPLNNDSDFRNTGMIVQARAERLNRPDWTYIATNGFRGTRPDGPPSTLFPWAGHFITRSGWDANAHWAFFDIGPLSIGHSHYDKLHLSISAYGRDILVDGGRYTYNPGAWRTYFKGSPSHNVLLIGGAGQGKYEQEATAPVSRQCAITPDIDYARGTFTGSWVGASGRIEHTRVLVYVRGQYWVVVDRVKSKRPREIKALWHFHPDCSVSIDGQSTASTDPDKGNLRIVPTASLDWNVELIRGQTEPDIQGWWSREYNHKQPNTCAVYTAPAPQEATFAWALIPAQGAVPEVKAALIQNQESRVRVQLQWPNGNQETLMIPLANTAVRRSR